MLIEVLFLVKLCCYFILSSWIFQPLSICLEETMNVDKWLSFLISEQNASINMIKKLMSYTWKLLMLYLFLVLLMINSLLYMVGFPQNWKQLMISKIFRDSKSLQELVYFVIFFGLIQLKMKKVLVLRSLFRMMSEDVHTFLANQQPINSCIKTNSFQF